MNRINKTYVLDTSVVIEDPEVFYRLGNRDIAVSAAVVKEIDRTKAKFRSG